MLMWAFRVNCGIGRNETKYLFEGEPDSVPELTDVLEADCDDGVSVLSTLQCGSGDGSDEMFTMTLLECVPDNHYGKATLEFENAAGSSQEPVIKSLRDASASDKPVYGEDVVSVAAVPVLFRTSPLFSTDLRLPTVFAHNVAARRPSTPVSPC